MKVDIYQSTKDTSKYISVPENTDMNTIQISEKEAEICGEVTTFKKSLNKRGRRD